VLVRGAVAEPSRELPTGRTRLPIAGPPQTPI